MRRLKKYILENPIIFFKKKDFRNRIIFFKKKKILETELFFWISKNEFPFKEMTSILYSRDKRDLNNNNLSYQKWQLLI